MAWGLVTNITGPAASNPVSSVNGATGAVTQDTITGLSSTGVVKRTGTNTLAIATAGTDYVAPGNSLKLSSSNTFTSYNTTDETTNYERVRGYWTSNNFYLVGESGGTGLTRVIYMSAASTTGNAGLKLNNSVTAGIVQAVTTTSSASSINFIANGTWSASSGTQYGVSISPTVNQSSTAGYTTLLVNPTESGTGSGTKLLADFQVGGTSKAKIDNTGAITATSVSARVIPRIGTTASSATPSIDCSLYDQYNITALAAAITGVTVTGTPTDGQKLLVRIKDNATARAITWGASFTSSGVAALLATTVISKTHLVGFVYDSAAALWVCVAVDATGY